MKKMNKRNKARITSKEATRQTQRRLLLESLEDRRLLAGSPELVSVVTNAGDHLHPTSQRLDYSPAELVFNFNAAANIDPSTLDGISIVSSGSDGIFATANVQSDLGTNGGVLVHFQSQIAGDAGNDIKLLVSKSDHGNASGPYVSIDQDDDHTILVDLNTNVANPTTATQLVDAINDDADASKLLVATITGGDGDTELTGVSIDYSPLYMNPTDDHTIGSGYVGLNDSSRDVVFRFADSIDEGKYRILIPGTGPLALRDMDGSPFNRPPSSDNSSNDGEDLSIQFEVELGARVMAVVPQPVVQNNGLREQLRDTVFVYFNNDDLESSTASDPSFYQLVYTNDTIDNTDDIVINPVSVDYSIENDLAQLTFTDDLDRLVPGGGTYRMRVGESTPLPAPPLQVSDLAIDAGDEFIAALDIGQSVQVDSDGSNIDDGDEFGIELSDGASQYFEFDRGWEMTVTGTGPLLGETFEISNDAGATSNVFEFVSDAANVSDPANFAVVLDTSVTQTPQSVRDAIQLAVVSSGLVADVGDLGTDGVHLSWESDVVVTESASNVTLTGTPGVDSAAAIPIQFRSDYTQRQVADAIASTINNLDTIELQADVNEQTFTGGNATQTTTYRVSLSGAKQIRLSDLRVTGGGESLVDGAVISATSSVGEVRNFEIDLGHVLELPNASTLEAKVLAVTQPDANGDPVLSEFEFDTDGSVTSGRTPILVAGDESASDLAETIKAHVEGVVDDITITYLGGNELHFGSNEQTSFTGTDATFAQVSTAGLNSAGNRQVSILGLHSKTTDEIASEIGAAINADGHVSGVQTFNSSISVGNTWSISLDAAATTFAETQDELASNSFESIKLTAQIGGDPDAVGYPGAIPTPGHRDIPSQSHVIQDPDSDAEVPVYTYSFPVEYGEDANGNILINAITDAQRQRTREVFDLYAHYLGIEFVEQDAADVDNSTGIKVAVGDMIALKNDPSDTDPSDGIDQTTNDTQNKPGGTQSVAYRQSAGIGTLILDYQDFQDPATERFGESFFREVMYRVGYILGLGHSDELAGTQIQGDEDLLEALTGPERIFPGSQDIRHGQILYRPDGNDIDVYNVTLDSTGSLDIEILAERLTNPSTLNAVVSVYRDGELIGRNDAYFSDDPRLHLEDLAAGQYTIAVSAAGNSDYDLNVPGTGRGGTSTGNYELNVVFTEARNTGLTDTDGTRLDGDLDGLAGGSHDTWHRFVSDDAGLAVSGNHLDLEDGDWIRITDASGTASAFVVDRTGGNSGSNIITVTDGMTESEFVAELASTVGSVNGLTTSVSTTGGSTIVYLGGVRKVEVSTQAGVIDYIGRNIFVAKDADGNGDGSLSNAYENLADAVANAQERDVIRLLASAGDDDDFGTLPDNEAYQLGFSQLNGSELEDGAALEIPKGVVVVVDAGSIFKMRRSRVSIGSSSPSVDRSGSALQVLGAPYLVSKSVDAETGEITLSPLRSADGSIVDGTVYFTSIYDEEIGTDSDPYPFAKDPSPSDWGGLDFRQDIDREQSNRIVTETHGLFLDMVNQVSLRYGGGSVIVDGVAEVVNPIAMRAARPHITNSEVTLSGSAAMSATPDSFREDTFRDSLSQSVVHTPNYDRVGPWIRGNEITENSINGLVINVATPIAGELLRVTQSTRWDDNEVVHVLPENLQLEGNVGGLVSENVVPPTSLITVSTVSGGAIASGNYAYRITYVDAFGNETPASDPVLQIANTAGSHHSIQLNRLPEAAEGFIARRIYRSEALDMSQWGTPGYDPAFYLVGEINQVVETFTDDGSFIGGMLDTSQSIASRPRLHGSLVVDPGVTVKLDGARIDALFGAHFFAEGTSEHPVVFTSLEDQRYGGSGSFDTRNAGAATSGVAGQWGGVYVGPTSLASIDYARIAYGGGTTREQGTFATFNAVELHQGELRLANSVLESNSTGMPNAATGDGSQANDLRGDFSTNGIGVIFVRGSQPIIVNNIIRDNWTGSQQLGITGEDIPAINIDVNSLNADYVSDSGRRTVANFPGGPAARRFDVAIEIDGSTGNQGPWIDGNVLSNNDINGLLIRGGTVTAAGVWDDTDITHVMTQEILVPDTHISGGLRLESSPYESLVVKAYGDDARIRAIGRPLDITDRIGGTVHIVGQPRRPVIITSVLDCTEGAGYLSDGSLQVHVDNSGACDADATAPIGNSGAVVVDGGDRDDHGSALDGPDGTAGTPDDQNQDGWLYIEQLMAFAFAGSRNGAPNDVLAIGIDPGGASGALAAITSSSVVNGHSLDFAFGAQISTVNFNDYKILYIPSSEGNVSGGIPDADSLLLAARKDEVREFINNGGSHVALTQATVPNPYAWLELPDQFIVTDFGGGGISYDLRKTQAAIDAGITISDADLSWGTPYHNDFVGPPGFNGLVPFVMDEGDDRIPGNADDRVIALGLGSGSFGLGVTPGGPGDWDGVYLDQFSHDTNVQLSTERERVEDHLLGELNDDINGAQGLGNIARDEYASDENARLGFTVLGDIASPDDIDTYSFRGETGSEVWLDIDRTAATLDTVLEVVDPQGNVIARSDNSADLTDPWHDDTRVTDHHVNTLEKSAHGIADQYSENPGDSGLRIVLPGTPASINTYYVRVYSNGHKSTGNYELNIRVREQDLIAGSTIQYADMRFGVNAVTVSGQPAHSPLVGESIEGSQAGNDETITGAQSLGNILNSDRATLSIAGSVNSSTDVDWYEFDVQYDSLYEVDKAHYDEDPSEARFVSVTIDVDYANGLGGPDTAISLFRQLPGGGAELVAIGEDSNIADDQAAPMSGNDLDDLSRGSSGVNDGYIGPLALTEGRYFLAVYPESMISEEQLQTLSAAAANPAVRIEPMPHFSDIVDRISDPQDLSQSTGVLFDADSVQPLHLGDVPLFITQGWGPRTNANPVRVINGVVDRQDPAADQTNVWVVDPLTGLSERRIEDDGTLTLGEMEIPCGTLTTQPEGSRADTLGSFRDLATRQDGSLFGFTVTDTNFVGGPVVTPQTVEGGWSDEQAGDYHQFDLSNCTSTFLGEDNIETHEPDGFGATDSVNSNAGDGHGIQFEALTFGWPSGGGVTTPTGLAVGNRPAFTWVQDSEGNWERQLEVHEGNVPHYQDAFGVDQELDMINLLYRFNVQNGDVVSAAPGDRGTGPALNEGAGTNKREIMQLVTDVALDPQATRAEMVLFDDATNVIIDNVTGIGSADWEVHDRDLVPVDLNDDGIADIAFQFNSGPDVRVTQTPDDDQYVVDGDRFFIDGQAFEVNTGATLVVNASNGTAVQRGYFDIEEDSRYANPQTYRFHLRHANAPGRLPGTDITGGDTHNVDIIIPFSTSITREQIAAIITDKIQNAFVDGNSNGIRDTGEAEFRVRATQHPGENSQHRIILEFDTGDVDISPAFTRTGRILDDVSISPLDSCVSQTLCVHGDSSLKDENAASAGNDYNGQPVVEVKYVGGSQITEFDDGEADDFWGQVEENTTRDNLIEAIKTATNGGTADWMRVGVGTVNTITVFSDVVITGGDPNQPKSADSAGDRLNFTNFTYATDTDGYPYAVAPAQDGFDELFDRGVFSLDFNGDGFVDAAGDEVMRNGAIDTSFTYLSAKETELRNRRPNNPLVPLGISSLQPSDIFEVDFGADWTGVDLAQEVSDVLMALAADSTTKIAQDEVSSDVTGAVVQIYDVLNDSGITFGWDTHNDLNSDGNVDPGEIEGHAKFMVTDDPHHLGGPAPGGLITGLAWIYQTQTELDLGVDANLDGAIDNAFVSYQPRLFAVSDSETDTSPAGGARSVGGGLFEITDPLGTIPGVPTALEYVPTAFNLRGINFQGLAAGPSNVEDGKYAETLFAIDADGVVYAFDTDGNFQSVFASGQSSVDSGLKNANGLAFGNLDYNLWHFTDTRGTEPGHGVNASSLTNQAAQEGGTSLYFGFEDLYVNDVLDSANPAEAARLVFDNPNILDQAGRAVGAGTYDFAGGASGSLTTKPFSLEDYSNGDAVHLFFNYLLETEDASGGLDPSTAAGFMADSFRVFISVDDGEWELLSTNNAFECDEDANPNSCTNDDDEYDMGSNVRETFDTGAWRQAMIDLSEHVGNGNARLRFDFATGGAMSTGDVTPDAAGQPIYPVGGQELILKPGYELADGDTVTIDGETFEFDLGYTLAIPAGASLQAGDGFTVTYKIGYDDPGTSIDDRISVTESFLFVETTPGWNLEVNRAATGEVVIPFDSGQTAKEVTATAESIMKLALETLILPTTGTDTFEGGLLAENNGKIDDAVVTPLVGGNFKYHAHGEIGDVPDDINTPGDDSLMDVDLIQMDPRVGDVVDVKVKVNVPPTGDYLQPALRFFDESGAELSVSVNSNIISGGGVGSDVLEVTARVVAAKTGKIYLGISSIGNESYDAIGGGGTTLPIDPATGLPRQVGQYDLSIETQDPDWPVIRYDNNQLQIVVAEELMLHGTAGSKLSASGLSGPTLPGSGNHLVDVRVNMSGESVAESFKDAYATQFANGQNDVVKGGTNSIYVIGHEVTDAGNFAVNGLLPGEAADNFYNNNTAANNQFEGVYIDDVFVAPTERGMVVTAGANATAFVANPVADADLITTGTYQVEIRRSFEYGALTEADLDGDGFDESFYAAAQQYHTNDRFTQRRSLVFPDGASLHDGLSFTISDGVNSVTFEFEDESKGDGVASGNQPVSYSVNDTDGQIALSFANALNSDAVQSVLDIKAAGQDFGGSTAVDETASNVINLIGNALFIRDGQIQDGVNAKELMASPETNADTLVSALLPDGASYSNVSVTAGDSSIGTFEGGHDVIGIARGVVLSTGDVSLIGQPNTDTELSGTASGVPSAVIDSELGVNTTDSTTLTFDFVAQGTSLYMNAVFASEEYPEALAYGESDKVAVFIDDPDTTGTTADFAVVEPTIGVHVSSSEVNNGAVFGIDPNNGHLYKDNSVEHSGPALNDFHSEGNTKREVFGFDGYTSVLTLEANGLAIGKTYRMTISIADVGDENQDSALFIEAGSVSSAITFGVDRDSVIGGINWGGYGDLNVERLQGQIVIDSNTFTSNESFGLNIEAGPRTDARVPLAGALPHPGGARNLGAGNPEQLAPGVVITNNVFADNEAGQLRIAGEIAPGNGENGVVPFSRVVNNTIVGGTDGSARPGIVVENNASPTILNNIIAFTTTGISVDGTSDTTVVGANVYGNNATDVSGTVAGDFSITTDGDTLFTNLGGENFYPAAGAASIDASMDSLQDRLSLKTLRESIGIEPSPILAPTVDRFGQLRVDDPEVATPTGLGLNVFKDRGAVDRADTVGPSAYLIMPRDNDRGGLDQNASADRVKVDGVNFSEFRIRLVDNLSPITTQFGAGIADESVAVGSVDLFKYEGVNLETLESCNCSLSEFTSEKLEHGVDYEFQFDATNNVIVLKSLAGTFESNQLYAITVRSGDGTILEIPNGLDLPDETYVDITDNYGETVRFEYDSGYVLQMPEAATLVLPDADNLTTLDRTSFEISGTGGGVTFEFDTDNSVFGSNVAIAYGLNATALEIADAAATAMNDADINLFARAISLDDGEVGIHLGANRDHTITLGNNSPLTQLGLPGAIDHHDSVIVDNGVSSVEFFFSFETTEDQDTAFEPTETVSSAVPMLVRHDMTQEELAQALASAIGNADLGLAPSHVEDGLIDVGGTFNHKIDLSNATTISEVGVPGLANSPLSIRVLGHSGLALAEDGDTFQIANTVSGVTVTYEFDNDGSVADPNAVAVNFTDVTTVGELVNEIVTETNNTGLGLEAYKSGASVVAFKDSTGVTVAVGNSDNAIEAIGTAGLDPAVGVVYSISDNSSIIAAATASAIVNVEGILFDDVAAVSGVDSVTITGADQVVSSDMDIVNVVNRAGVRDNAGNSILPNGTDGMVTFLIEAGVEFDYGDAPEPYRTSKEDGGPSHIVVNGFSLGDSISTESNAVSDDLDDGVTFATELHAGYSSEVVVDFNNDAGLPMGMLDAWIDFDRDNVFEDGEKIITAHRLDEGLNTITIATPEHTFPGTTYARFRLSSRGGGGPLGVEMDGEVEDYQVTINGNPWLNPFEPTDVNRDGHITPIDALMIINHLDKIGGGPLPVPPTDDFNPDDDGYLDVSDDGQVSPIDALHVINKLNDIFADDGDAEGEYSGLDDVIASISQDVEEARDSDDSEHDDFFAGL